MVMVPVQDIPRSSVTVTLNLAVSFKRSLIWLDVVPFSSDHSYLNVPVPYNPFAVNVTSSFVEMVVFEAEMLTSGFLLTVSITQFVSTVLPCSSETRQRK